MLLRDLVLDSEVRVGDRNRPAADPERDELNREMTRYRGAL